MTRASSALADKLADRFRQLERNRHQIEGLRSKGLLTKGAMHTMYEGLFLSAHVAFEGFLEELFLGLLVKDKGVKSRRLTVVAKVEITSHAMARALVLGPDKEYIDWVPFNRTIKLAKVFFKDGRPFSKLKQPHKDILFKAHIIRNVIAHKSKHSLKKFRKHIIVSSSISPVERSPAGYLRGVIRITPTQTRFSILLSQLLLCARYLAK